MGEKSPTLSHEEPFFCPLDFTFVCPSEILAFDERLDEFTARNAAVVGVSVDSAYTHLAWKKTPVEKGGIGPIRYPLVSDLKRDIARRYGVLLDEEVALRGLFLIDREGRIRHSVMNDLSLGRSVAEALRMLDALRFHDERGQVCPANWQEGDEGMVPSAQGVGRLPLQIHEEESIRNRSRSRVSLKPSARNSRVPGIGISMREGQMGEIRPRRNLSTPFHKYGNVFVRASRGPGAAGGSYERPMERGGNCVERNGSERSQVASVAKRKPPASPGHREEKRLRASP